MGHEQDGTRPVVVVSSPAHLAIPSDLALVVPLTRRDHVVWHHVPIASPATGLSGPSWARPENLRAVSTQRFGHRKEPLGVVSDEELAALLAMVRAMLL